MNVIEVKNLKKAFGDHVIFNNLSFYVKEGEFLAIEGRSGSGKSTLLNMLGMLDKPDSGDIMIFNEKNIRPFTRKAESFLKEKIGYLFQNFALLDQETVYYNMMLAIEHQKIDKKKECIEEALEKVGLKGYADKKVYKCSGGEQQRISIARLLIKPCSIVLADEPTGSLDEENKKLVFDLLLQLQKIGKTVVVVSHDPDLIAIADRTIKINDNDEG